jgi:hypothetical protein
LARQKVGVMRRAGCLWRVKICRERAFKLTHEIKQCVSGWSSGTVRGCTTGRTKTCYLP